VVDVGFCPEVLAEVPAEFVELLEDIELEVVLWPVVVTPVVLFVGVPVPSAALPASQDSFAIEMLVTLKTGDAPPLTGAEVPVVLVVPAVGGFIPAGLEVPAVVPVLGFVAPVLGFGVVVAPVLGIVVAPVVGVVGAGPLLVEVVLTLALVSMLPVTVTACPACEANGFELRRVKTWPSVSERRV